MRKRGVLDEAEIDAIVARTVERLRTGTTILSVAGDPISNLLPMIYVPEVGEFLIFYEW